MKFQRCTRINRAIPAHPEATVKEFLAGSQEQGCFKLCMPKRASCFHFSCSQCSTRTSENGMRQSFFRYIRSSRRKKLGFVMRFLQCVCALPTNHLPQAQSARSSETCEMSIVAPAICDASRFQKRIEVEIFVFTCTTPTRIGTIGFATFSQALTCTNYEPTVRGKKPRNQTPLSPVAIVRQSPMLGSHHIPSSSSSALDLGA